MKKSLLIVSLFVAAQVHAALGDMVPLPSWKGRAAANGDVILKTESVNSSGTPVPTPGGPINLPTPTPGIQPVSSTATTAYRYEASATYLTSATTSINVTSTAGTAGRYNVTLRAVRGGTSLVYAINASATPQATVATLDGREVITAASHKTEGPCYEAGTHVHIRASGTASVVGTLILEQCK